MEKRKLSTLPRPEATAEMVEMADRLDGMEHIVTAELVEDNKILLLNFYEVSKLKKGKTEAAFRTFLSSDDYITQDLSQSKVKWLTAAFDNIQGFRLWEYKWDQKTWKSEHIPKVFIWTAEDKGIMESFFKAYRKDTDENVWNAIDRFQDKVKAERLAEKHRKVLAPIDLRMEPIGEPSQDFTDWVWEHGMSFSRYGIYKETSKGKAEFECTHCQKTGIVDRSRIRLRNNEKGECPFCGSRVTYKARGKMPYQIVDERWFIYVDRQEEGFLLRYFKAWRHIKNDAMITGSICKKRIEETMHEYSRCFCTFSGKTMRKESYEWGVYHQKGNSRWIPDEGKIACMECILYPGNLPQAWEHTPMKYSALEILSQNIPTTAFRYEDAIDIYLKFPKLEWFCKMGLNQLAKDVVNNLRDHAEKKNISLDYCGIPINIQGVRHVLYEMLYNIADNAVRYTNPGGHIHIYVGRKGDHPFYRVEDDGIGIPKSEQKRIFERFYRVDKSHSRQTGGTGLGLSIVKHGATLHHAQINVDSDLGKGTKMELLF